MKRAAIEGKMMHKLVTERPRVHDCFKRKGRKANLEDSPRREKMGMRAPGNTKEFTDVLGPLYHYLRKQVGRPWHKVHSELRKQLPPTSIPYIHVWSHIEGLVCTQTGLNERGEVVRRDGSSSTDEPIVSYGGYYKEMYVHPVNGLLCLAKQKRRERYRPKKEIIKVEDGYYAKVNGVWYELFVTPFVKVTHQEQVKFMGKVIFYATRSVKMYDFFKKSLIDPDILHSMYDGWFRCVGTTQLNKREIKKLGLRQPK